MSIITPDKAEYINILFSKKERVFIGIKENGKIRISGDRFSNTIGCKNWRFCSSWLEIEEWIALI